jgi:hypothetical protein
MEGSDRDERLTNGLLALHRRKDMSEVQRAVLLDAANALAWDDAIHIAAPWEPRSSLCGNWNRNLVSLGDPRPNGVAGCWTCLMAATWLDQREPLAPLHKPGGTR